MVRYGNTLIILGDLEEEEVEQAVESLSSS